MLRGPSAQAVGFVTLRPASRRARQTQVKHCARQGNPSLNPQSSRAQNSRRISPLFEGIFCWRSLCYETRPRKRWDSQHCDLRLAERKKEIATRAISFFDLSKNKLVEALLSALDKYAFGKLRFGYGFSYVGDLLAVYGYTALLYCATALAL